MHVIDRQRELFQQDNARPHTARVTMNYLEQNNINVLPWPYKSPDYHDTTSTEVIHFLNTGGRETFIPAPIYTYSAITFLQQRRRFVAEPNSSPVSECPAP
jgi:hypothetical protein